MKTEEYINTNVVNLHNVATTNLVYSVVIEKELCEIAEKGYPFEVCGFLIGNKECPNVVKRLVQVRNKAIEQERRFEIDSLDYMKVEREVLARGEILMGIFHSHPGYPAIPSVHDLKFAVKGFFYPIISIEGNGQILIRSWLIEGEKFINQNIKIN